MAVLDEIAQDIRNELDKLEVEQALPTPLPAPESTTQLVASEPENQPATSEREPEAPPEVPVPLQTKPSPTVEAIQAAFRKVFGREPDLGGKDYGRIVSTLRESGLSSESEIENALRLTMELVNPLMPKFSVNVTDYGYLIYAPFFAADAEEGVKKVEAVFEKLAQGRQERQQFEATYKVNREVLGTVVHVVSDYALVQLPEGDTGIIHVTTMKANPRNYLDAHKVVKEGETVRVRIIKANAVDKRIELSLVR